MDYEGLNAVLNCNMGIQATQLACEGTELYDSSITGYAYQPELAIELLKSAGYSEENPLKVKINTTSMNMETAVAVQGEWMNTGLVDCEIKVYEYAALQEMTDDGSWDGYVIYNYVVSEDTANVLFQILGTGTRSYGNGIQGSSGLYQKAQLALNASEKSRRISQIQELNREISEQCLITPLFIKPTYYLANEIVHDIHMDYTSVNQWKPETVYKG